MSIIGTFTKKDNRYEGTIRTLTYRGPARFVPLDDRAKESSPHFRVYADNVELGAAWEKRDKDGVVLLSVALDDPSFQKPINGALVADPEVADRYNLIWNRSREVGSR